jgi:hypothetical protein
VRRGLIRFRAVTRSRSIHKGSFSPQRAGGQFSSSHHRVDFTGRPSGQTFSAVSGSLGGQPLYDHARFAQNLAGYLSKPAHHHLAAGEGTRSSPKLGSGAEETGSVQGPVGSATERAGERIVGPIGRHTLISMFAPTIIVSATMVGRRPGLPGPKSARETRGQVLTFEGAICHTFTASAVGCHRTPCGRLIVTFLTLFPSVMGPEENASPPLATEGDTTTFEPPFYCNCKRSWMPFDVLRPRDPEFFRWRLPSRE